MNIDKKETIKLSFAELAGTFFLVVIGAGPNLFTTNIFTEYFSFPIALAIVCILLMNTARAQVNPVSSIGLFINKKISLKHMLLSILCQIIGASLGGLLLWAVYKSANISTPFNPAGDPVANADYKNGLGLMFTALLVTFIAAFIYIYATLHIVNNEKLSRFSFLLIPFVFIGANALASSIDGANCNFAVKIGLGIFNAKEVFKTIWVPLVGNLLGAIVAGFVGNALLKARKPKFEYCEGDDCQ